MKTVLPFFTLGILLLAAFSGERASAQSPYTSSSDFARYASRLRESAIVNIEPQVIVPTRSRPLSIFGGGGYPWKTSIVTTVFWAGEAAAKNNPVHNRSSSWDLHWAANFGGFDNPDPSARIANGRDFRPSAFIPRQNPFYVALPYNDVTRGTTKPEAATWIPWFKQTFVKQGQSVCRDRWVAIRKGRKVCYAQWSDCGPFRTDHYQYVFGNERPKPNLNQGAGLDVSPSVRDYLGLAGKDVTDWKFVEFRDVPKGPWSMYGDNNHFVQRGRNSNARVVTAEPRRSTSAEEGPRVITK